MPALPPSELSSRLVTAMQESGATSSIPGSSNPRKISVLRSGTALEVWIYVWTVSFGGRRTLPNEFRIQITGVASPLAKNPNGPTVLLGYYPDLDVFAGFDLAKHEQFAGYSPSVQIDRSALEACLRSGIALHKKSNDEIAVGIRPDMLLDYVILSEGIHKTGTVDSAFALMEAALEDRALPADDVSAQPEPRRRVIEEVSRLHRAANFQRVVLGAYDNRCAISKTQLKLVEAAHIVPITDPQSRDLVTNGIALAPTYHRAYDSGLIFLDEDLRFKINPGRESYLVALRQDGGLADFKSAIANPLYLPIDRRQRPTLAVIRAAKRARGIG